MLPTPGRPYFGSFVRDQIEDLRGLDIDVSVLFVDGVSRSFNYLRGTVELRHCLSESQFDLVHAHYGITGAVAVTQRRVPVVTTFHGSDCSGEIPWQKIVSWGVARACTPIFVSERLAASIGCHDATIIPAAVDLERFTPDDRVTARRQLGWPEDAEIALLLGSRSNPVKDPALFEAAVEEARSLLPGLWATSLEGFSRDRVALAMNAADVTVMTSRAEGSPITVRESLACCTPVVSVPVGDVKPVLADLPGCAVTERRADAVARALVAAVAADRDSRLRDRAAESARPVIAERIVAVYRGALEIDG